MKYAFIALLLLALISCREEETYCYQCVESINGQSTTFNRCGITEKESNDIERAGTEIDPEGLKHPFGVDMKRYTVCSKQ